MSEQIRELIAAMRDYCYSTHEGWPIAKRYDEALSLPDREPVVTPPAGDRAMTTAAIVEKLREQAHSMESPYWTKTPAEPSWTYVAKAFREIADDIEQTRRSSWTTAAQIVEQWDDNNGICLLADHRDDLIQRIAAAQSVQPAPGAGEGLREHRDFCIEARKIVSQFIIRGIEHDDVAAPAALMNLIIQALEREAALRSASPGALSPKPAWRRDQGTRRP